MLLLSDLSGDSLGGSLLSSGLGCTTDVETARTTSARSKGYISIAGTLGDDWVGRIESSVVWVLMVIISGGRMAGFPKLFRRMPMCRSRRRASHLVSTLGSSKQLLLRRLTASVKGSRTSRGSALRKHILRRMSNS